MNVIWNTTVLFKTEGITFLNTDATVPVSFRNTFSIPWFGQFSQNNEEVIFIFNYFRWQRFEKSRSKPVMKLLVISFSFTQLHYLRFGDTLVRTGLVQEMLVSSCWACVLTCIRNTATQKAPERNSLLSNAVLENLLFLKKLPIHIIPNTQDLNQWG